MINLAGDKDCDKHIRGELRKARIPVVTLSGTTEDKEVPYTLIGCLGGFSFERAWYYYIVKGKVPLRVAKIIYLDPACSEDVRVAGHCGAPPPEKWVDRIDKKSGKLVISRKEWDKGFSYGDAVRQLLLQNYVAADTPGIEPESFVTTYHIDTEVGLRVFVDYLKEYGVIPKTVEI